MVRSDCRRHHALQGEVQQSEVHEEKEPQELCCRPLERTQAVEDCAVDK
jgi:hypothetical protein